MSRQPFRSYILYAAFLVGVYLVFEGAVCLSGLFLSKERMRYVSDFYRPDSTLGFCIRPNLDRFSVTWFDGELETEYSTDSLGFRNVGRDYNKARYFFVGDSFTFGSWIARDKTFYGFFESALGEDVITLGVGGYGLTQYRTLITDHIPKNDTPKTVYLCIFANDLTIPELPEYLRNYYSNAGWEAYTNNLSLLDRFTFRRTLTFRLLTSIYARYFGVGKSARATENLTLYQYRGASRNYLSDREYLAFESDLSALIDDVRNRGDITLVALLFPSKESVYREYYQQRFGDAGYLANEETGFQRIIDLFSRHAISCYDLTDPLRKQASQLLYFDRDPHCNAAGHRAIYDYLSDTLGL